MFKNAFVVAVAAVAFVGCGLAEMQVDEQQDSLGESVGEVRGCTQKCRKCPPGKVCAMVCEPVGNCGTTCTETMLCIQGYYWNSATCQCEPSQACAVRCASGYTLDESTCSCVPSGGSSCGTATCAAGQVCCNSSCGICTEPGGACIQLYCGATI